MLEEGLYDDAVQAYNAILAQDPQDEDALIGRKKAREGWIDRRLIEVRQNRMAGDAGQAIGKLLEIVNHEREWSLSPGGKVAFTQGEERDYAIIYSQREVHRALGERHPLEAHVWLTRYAPVLESLPDARVQQLRAETQRLGTDSCKPWLKSGVGGGKPNLDRMLRQYCELFGPVSWPPPQPRAYSVAPYVGAGAVEGTIAGLPADLGVYLETQLRKAIEASAFFQTGADRSLPVTLKGRYEESHGATQETRTQVYGEDVPYTERVKVEKSRSVPVTQQLNGQVVTNYRTETYQDWETVTKHRTVYKQYQYLVTRKEQRLGLEIQGKVGVTGVQPFAIAIEERSEEFGFEHDESHPAIGLSPQRAKLPNPAEWSRHQIDAITRELGAKLADSWDARYCRDQEAGQGILEGGEAVAMCLRQRHEKAPGFAQQWFRANFGVSAEDAQQALRYP